MTPRPLLLLLLLVSALHGHASTWVHRAPSAAYVVDLAAVPGSPTLFAATTGGLFRSDDDGDRWTHVTAIPRSSVRVVLVDALDARSIYAGGTEGMFRSADGGATWSLALAGSVRAAAFDPLRATLWAIVGADGLYRSLDRGNSWTRVTAGTAASLLHLTVRPDNGTVYVGGSDSSVVASSDGGATWKSVPRPDQAAQPLSLFGTSGALLMETSSGLFRTTNDGAAWTAVPRPHALARITSYAADAAGVLYVGTEKHGVFRRNGETWQAVGNETHLASVTALEWRNGALFAGTPGHGAFRTTSSATWSAPRVPIATASVNALAADPRSPSTLYAGTERGLFRSSDRGESWTRIGFPESRVVALLVHEERLTVATWEEGVFHSSDGGATWKRIESQVVTGIAMIAADPRDARRIAAATLNGFYISDDGATWKRGNSVGGINGVAFDPFDAQTILISTTSGIWRSTDGGMTFARFGTAPSGVIRFIANDPLDPTRIYASSVPSGLSVSTNRGETWSVVDARLAIPTRNGLASLGSTFVAASGQNLFRSLDGGRTWAPLDGPGTIAISSVTIEPQSGALWIGSTSGIFRAGTPRRRAARH